MPDGATLILVNWLIFSKICILVWMISKKYAIIHTENQIALVINALQNWLWHRPAQRPARTHQCTSLSNVKK